MDINTSKLEGIYYVAVPPEESLKKKFRGAVYKVRATQGFWPFPPPTVE